MDEKRWKEAGKWIGIIAVFIILIFLGAVIYEKLPNLFGFLGLTSLNDKAGIIRDLNKQLGDIQRENLATVNDLTSGNESLRAELSTAIERERDTAESLETARNIIKGMAGSIGTATGAVEAIRIEAERIQSTAGQIRQGIRELREAGRGTDPAVEDRSD